MYSAIQLGPHLDGNVQEKLFVKYLVKLKQPERFFEGNYEGMEYFSLRQFYLSSTRKPLHAVSLP